MFRLWLWYMGWVFMTLGVFSIASPFLPKYSRAQEEQNDVLYVFIGLGLVALGVVLVRRFRGRE